MAYTRRMVLFDGTSGTSSTFTSDWHLVTDYNQLALSWTSSDGGASRLTVQGSGEDGFSASITSSSDLTTATLQGYYTIDSGVRWIRALRSSLDSLGELHLEGRSGG